MKPWIYIFITTEQLNFAKMSVTILLHSHDEVLNLNTSQITVMYTRTNSVNEAKLVGCSSAKEH